MDRDDYKIDFAQFELGENLKRSERKSEPTFRSNPGKSGKVEGGLAGRNAGREEGTQLRNGSGYGGKCNCHVGNPLGHLEGEERKLKRIDIRM